MSYSQPDTRMTRKDFLNLGIAFGIFGLMTNGQTLYNHLQSEKGFNDKYKPSNDDCLKGSVKTGVFDRSHHYRSNGNPISHKKDNLAMTYAQYAPLASDRTWYWQRASANRNLMDFLREARRQNDVVHLALEPSDHWPDVVRENRQLYEFAYRLNDSQLPIILRFGAEMNGNWTKYHGDPEAFQKAFRTVSKVMHSQALGVKMLWSPDANGKDPIPYYPGDKYVDAIGVSAYFTPLFPHSLVTQTKQRENDIDVLAEKILKPSADFAIQHGKPFVVSEWGAAGKYNDGTHQEDWSDFQERALIKMYKEYVERFGITAICYFNANLIGQSNETSPNKSWAITQDLYDRALSSMPDVKRVV